LRLVRQAWPLSWLKEVTPLSVETFTDGLSAARRAGRISEDFYDQVTHLAWAVHETQRIADSLGDPDDDTFEDLGCPRGRARGYSAVQGARAPHSRGCQAVSLRGQAGVLGMGDVKERRG
jgi:hypothetical protein